MSGKPAARVTDPTACSLPGHGTNPIVSGSPDVFFDGLPAARQDDTTKCGGALVSGFSTTVFINGKPAATVDSVGSHGNKVTAGSSTVIIGNSHTPATFIPPEPVIIAGVFNRIFDFRTAAGKTVEGLNYTIRSQSGLEKKGSTSSGVSYSFSTGKTAETVIIYISAD